MSSRAKKIARAARRAENIGKAAKAKPLSRAEIIRQRGAAANNMMNIGMPRPTHLGGQRIPSNVPFMGGYKKGVPKLSVPPPIKNGKGNGWRPTPKQIKGAVIGGAVAVGVAGYSNRSGRATDPGTQSMYGYGPRPR